MSRKSQQTFRVLTTRTTRVATARRRVALRTKMITFPSPPTTIWSRSEATVCGGKGETSLCSTVRTLSTHLRSTTTMTDNARRSLICTRANWNCFFTNCQPIDRSYWPESDVISANWLRCFPHSGESVKSKLCYSQFLGTLQRVNLYKSQKQTNSNKFCTTIIFLWKTPDFKRKYVV